MDRAGTDSLSPLTFRRDCQYRVAVKLLLGIVGAVVALVASAPAQASIPLPWCGTSSSAIDRQPDSTPGFAVHVAYVRPPDAPDRFAEFAPRIVGDIAAIEEWWKSQDASRALRFDLYPFPCESAFGALDITNVALTRGVAGINDAFVTIRSQLASGRGFHEPEKVYLVYYDGPTGQAGLEEERCGEGAESRDVFGLPAMAVVYVDSCLASESDIYRPIVAVHELMHVLGAVPDQAPHVCQGGHVCDVETDLMWPSLTGNALESHVLDSGRDDYYGHSGAWTDVQDSLFLERLDSPDRAAPTVPTGLSATNDSSGLVALSWRPSTDDVGPVAYRLYQNGSFLRQFSDTKTLLSASAGGTSNYSLRATDAVGHLSQPTSIRFKVGLGIVDEQGRLVRDTVRPAAVRNVSVRRTATTVRLSWPAARRRRPPRLPDQTRGEDPHGDEARRDAEPADAAHRRLRRGGRPGRQHRPDHDRPAAPAALMAAPL